MQACSAPGEQRFQANGAERGFLERQALFFGWARIVAGDDHIDQAVAQRLHERDAIIFRSQRRRELGEGAIAVDVLLVEREVMHVDAGERLARRAPWRASTASSVCADDSMSSSRRAAGEFGEREIAFGHDAFGGGGNAGQAQARGEFAFVHHAAFGEVGIFRAMRDAARRSWWHKRARGGARGCRGDRLVAVAEACTAPASARRPISVISSPSRCLVSAAAGRMCTPPLRSSAAAEHEVDQALIVDHRRRCSASSPWW